MARHTFTGGIHPLLFKELSRNQEIRTVLPFEGEMAFPLQQHTGNPAVPCVRAGDWVLTGQRIARADGALSANLHSSVSGRVLGFADVPDTAGNLQPSIIIQNDGRYQEMLYPADRDLQRLTRQTVLTQIRDAGIVGMGGSGLPTDYKLSNCDEQAVDTIIGNGVECEPYLTSDQRRVIEDPWKVINGMMVLLRIFPKARGVIAVSESNREGNRILRQCLIDNPRIYVRACREKYPQGSERQLIHALTGRTLNAKMLPFEIGCLVFNTDTLVAINQAVIMHEPLITRIMTVSGQAAASPCNLRVRLGETYRDVLEQAGGLKRFSSEKNTLILDGGPMMGHEIVNLDAPVTKLSSAIICIPKERAQRTAESPCIRCRRCMQVCPSRIVPMALIRDVRGKRKSEFVDHAGMECCECGCCSYICPAGIDLASEIAGMKRSCLENELLSGDYARRYSV